MNLVGDNRPDYLLGGIDDERQPVFVGSLKRVQAYNLQAASDILITQYAA